MSLIWEKCQGKNHIQKIHTEAYRVVETQHVSSTRKLVDSVQEHEILEDLIEHSKPPLDFSGEFHNLHYLLFTPFRYPPLKHGSRFGRRFERSLWYGSLDIETALAEVAFYRLYFLLGSEASFGMVEALLTAFSVGIKTAHGINLTLQPFLEFKTDISSSCDYTASQALGSQMREHLIEAFLYFSARRRADAVNVGLFTPKAFETKKPKQNSFQTWQCITTNQGVEFLSLTKTIEQKMMFPIEDFHVEGKFPSPCY